MKGASEILAISNPLSLFPKDEAAAKDNYRALARHWHPDRPSGNAEVFAHIAKLYHSLGEMEWAIFAPPGDRKKWLLNRRFRFATEKMEKECARYLPIDAVREGSSIKVRKAKPELRPLREVLVHFKGNLEPRHTGWIVSSLLNLCCYFEWAKIVHCDISPDSFFIDPKSHSTALLGGWWDEWVLAPGERVHSVPGRTFTVLPWSVQKNKRATLLINLEQVKLIGRECGLKDLPKAMKDWLMRPAVGTALTAYFEWRDILKKCFGEPKFHEMKGI